MSDKTYFVTNPSTHLTECFDNYFSNIKSILSNIDYAQIEKAIKIINGAWILNKTIYIVGNGGLAAVASHFACDLTKATRFEGAKKLKAISLVDNISLITAWGNDTDFIHIFSQQLLQLIQKDDVLICLSTSGASKNIMQCCKIQEPEIYRIGITGEGEENKLLSQGLLDHNILIPSTDTQYLEDITGILTHVITRETEAMIRGMCAKTREELHQY